MTQTEHNAFIQHSIQQSIELKSQLLQQPALLKILNKVSNRCIQTFKQEHRLLIAGNGGRAADIFIGISTSGKPTKLK